MSESGENDWAPILSILDQIKKRVADNAASIEALLDLVKAELEQVRRDAHVTAEMQQNDPAPRRRTEW